MRGERPTSLADRAATRLLERIGAHLWGFSPRLMPVIVRELGAAGALRWFVANMPRYERTLKLLGPARTHLLAAVISMRTGCRYCAFGHAYAFELIILRDQGALFPLDVGDLLDLVGADPMHTRARLAEALAAVGMGDELGRLDRLLALQSGAPAESDEDRRIAHLIAMFAVLNQCGIAGEVTPDAAHDPVNKDEVLKVRYHDLRRRERGLAG